MMDSQPKTCDRISLKEVTIDTVLAKLTRHYDPFLDWKADQLRTQNKKRRSRGTDRRKATLLLHPEYLGGLENCSTRCVA